MLVDRGVEEQGRFETLLSGVRHRGPDDTGRFECPVRSEEGALWLLGHQRLSVIDLTSAGHQPMVDRQTGNVIVFNGEVYNFLDLRAELETEGLEFQSRTDTEVVLLGYRRWGTDVVNHLRGMFAFALWDGVTGAMMLARDRLGEKPLYYCCQPVIRGVHFAFASEVRSILSAGLVRRSMDAAAFQSYMSNGFVIGPQTLINGVKLLDPGTVLTIDAHGTRRFHRYWEVPLRCSGERVEDGSAIAVRRCLSDAVRGQLVSDVPLGAFLSGGIDSSVVVGLAQQHRENPLRTFTLVFEEDEYNEARFARLAADAFKTDHHEIMLTRADFQRSLPEALGAFDQPSFDGANMFFIARAARQLGLTVALAGTGGDELFGGYASYTRLAGMRRLRRLASLAPDGILRGLRRAALWADGRRRGGFPSQAAFGKALSLLSGRNDLLHIYQAFYRIFLPETVAALVIDYKNPLSPDGLQADFHDYLLKHIVGRTDLAALSFLELHNYLGNRLLRDGDTMSMAMSLEVRLPLVDYQLIEAADALDERTRYCSPGSKRCLVAASGLCLPGEITNRKKSGFVLPIDAWLRDTLRHEASDTLLDAALCRRIGLRPAPVAMLWSQFLRGDAGVYWTRIWAIFVLLRWCDKHDVSCAA